MHFFTQKLGNGDHAIMTTATKPPQVVAIFAAAPESSVGPPADFAAIACDALQRVYGTPEEAAVDPDDLGEAFGHKIPPALAEIAALLRRAEGRDPQQRTPAQNLAVQRFVTYIEAEGGTFTRRPS